MLKRLGHNVHILEQQPTSSLSDRAAGIGAGSDVPRFLDEFDLTKQPYSLDCPGIQFVDGNSKVTRFWKRLQRLTGWSTLYHRLRANFDVFASAYCVSPPEATGKEGRATYDVGKRVTNVLYRMALLRLFLKIFKPAHQPLFVQIS